MSKEGKELMEIGMIIFLYFPLVHLGPLLISFFLFYYCQM